MFGPPPLLLVEDDPDLGPLLVEALRDALLDRRLLRLLPRQRGPAADANHARLLSLLHVHGQLLFSAYPLRSHPLPR